MLEEIANNFEIFEIKFIKNIIQQLIKLHYKN